MGSNRLTPPMLSLKDLIYSYPGQPKPALNELSLSVQKETIFGILGPNGGGKSTTFKILSTLIRPDKGSVEINGIDVIKSPDKVRSLLGIVFQSPALDKKLTVEENLHHQGHLYGIKGKLLEDRTTFLLKRLGLWEKRNEKTENLSGGQKRRLEITKSLIHEPQILILDEPTTGLDPLARREVWNYLKFLRETEKITILVTTHLLEEAEDCDEIALIDQGRVVCEGRPSQLRHEMGSDLVSIRTSYPSELRENIRSKFDVSSSNLGNQLRVQPKDLESFVSYLVKEGSSKIDNFTVGKPTLEDLFIEKTGHHFWIEKSGKDSEVTA